MVAAAVVAVAENHKPAAVQMVELATIMVAQEQHGQMVLHMLAAEEEDRKLVPHMLLVEPAEAAEASRPVRPPAGVITAALPLLRVTSSCAPSAVAAVMRSPLGAANAVAACRTAQRQGPKA